MGLFEENVAKLKAMPQNGNWNQFAGYNAQELNAAIRVAGSIADDKEIELSGDSDRL